LTPTLDFAPAIVDLTDEMRPVRRGLGDLILQSKPTHSGIAVFYSVPSALANRLENGREFTPPDQTHQNWTRLTYELGLDFRYVTSAMVKQGALDTKEFKAVLLPMSQALSPEEAEAIRKFVNAGGVVIADVRPGIYDGHCKPIMPGALDDVFGIKRTGRGKGVRMPVAIKASLGDQAIDFQAAQAIADPEVEPATAQALALSDKTPLLLTNQLGAGCAILLNFQLLSDKPEDSQTVAARQLLKALYSSAGVKASVSATDSNGGPLPLTETRIWQNGDGLVFGMWRQMKCAWFSPDKDTSAGEPVPAKVTLPEARHVYDLRAQKYLGNVTEINTALRWGRANFFMALPYEIKGVEVALSSAEPKPGQVITADIRLQIPAQAKERHAVWVEITDPQGQDALWGRQVVILNNGAAQVQVPVAYNDAPGKWTLRATELFSNKSAEASWSIAGAPK